MNDRPIVTPLTRVLFRRVAFWTWMAGLWLLACGPGANVAGFAQQKAPSPPSWYTKLPTDPQFLYAKATASSKDKQLAIDKALHDARVDLGRMVQGRLDSVRRSAEREASLDLESTERYQNAGEKIAADLKGSRVRNQKQVKKSKVWTAFVVVEMPVGATSDALVRAVQDDGLLSPTLGPTQAFRALDAEAAAYRAKRTSSQKKK